MRGGIFMVYYFSSEKHDAHIDFSKKLSSFLNSADAFSHPIAVMCIGSDRSTGDSLGPLIGYKLSKFAFNNVFIYGSLNNPINAVNLEFAITFIKNFHSNPYIIAIDASLGRNDHVGCITLAEGPLRPGLGVKKELPKVGSLHITGIVNAAGSKENLLLQTTRLSTVMTLADLLKPSVTINLTFILTHSHRTPNCISSLRLHNSSEFFKFFCVHKFFAKISFIVR